MAESDITDPFQSLMLEVTLPGSDPVRQPVPIFPNIVAASNPGRSRFFYRQPLLIPGPTLRAGHIEAKVIHEKGEIVVGSPWIILHPSAAKPEKAN
jgi:hypothetical protein